MRDSVRATSILLLWGVLVVLGAAYFYTPGDRVGLGGDLRWLTLLLSTVLGGGLILSGVYTWKRGRAYTAEMRIPALVLAGIGLLAMSASVLIFRPWAYEGLAGGIRGMAVAGFILGGGLLVATGITCYWKRTPTVPLLALAVLTGGGLALPVYESRPLIGVHTNLWILVGVLFLTGPPIALYYAWPRVDEGGRQRPR